jgi:predicted NBD/HSP70 family sugar kinase
MAAKKDHYRHLIIRRLYFSHPLSCADLSKQIGKSLPLTTKLINELVRENILIDTGLAPSSGGRRAATYSLRHDVYFIVSVALDQYVARIAVMDMRNGFVTPVENFELQLLDNASALTVLTKHIQHVIRKSGIDKQRILGIGIGMPGFVDVKKGVNYSYFKTDNESFTAHLSGKTGLPVFIDNDSSVIALAELRFGLARKKKNAMVINVGWGIGLGLILDGDIYRGHNGFAGEFSHIPLFLNGKLCSCGKRGCLETETSLLVIVEKARQALQNGRLSMLKSQHLDSVEHAWEVLGNAALQGDEFVVELFSGIGYNIGKGVAILIHLLNPQTIILSGRGSSAGKIWQPPIQHALNAHCIPRLAAGTTIEISRLGYRAELIGAAALVMDNFGKEAEAENVEEALPGYHNN